MALMKNIQPTLELKVGNESALKYTVAKVEKEEKVGIEKVFASFEDLGFFDTGLMPRKDTGLINYRRAAGYESFVFQVAPGAHKIIWGEEEGGDAQTYNVAMPYRIIIGDHQWNGKSYNMVGARHFYSYKPITSWSDIMYHCNVPNLNCRGYSGTGVGWICLYHTQNYTGFDLNKRIMATCMRTAGGEAYNDANMSSTDGTRFYEDHGAPHYFTDPVAWQKKTAKDGWKWTTDPESKLLLPVKLAHPAKNEMIAHVNNGKEASIFDLTRGLYRAYYSHPVVLKPHNLMDPDNPFVSEYPSQFVKDTTKYIQEFFDGKLRSITTLTVKGWAPELKKKKCGLSGKMFPEDDLWHKYIGETGEWIQAHQDEYFAAQNSGQITIAYTKKPNGGVGLHKAWTLKSSCVQVHGEYYHKKLKTAQCSNCDELFIGDIAHSKPNYDSIIATGGCLNCKTKVECSSCHEMYLEEDTKIVQPTDQIKVLIEDVKGSIVDSWLNGNEITPRTITLKTPAATVVCNDCAQQTQLCLCGHLVTPENAEQIVCQTMGNGSVVCQGCTSVNGATKEIEYLPNHIQFQTAVSAVKIAKSKG